MNNETVLTKLKKYSKSFLWGFPIIGDFLQRKYLQEHFGVEMELIKGNHQNENNHRSIIHLSVNKAATQYVRNLLRRCASENGLVNVGMAEYAFHTCFPYLDTLSADQMKIYQRIFCPTGYLYSVFGGMIEGIEDFERYLVIFMVRDPRDVLVSEYFSFAYSHSEPSRRGNKYNDFMMMRQKAQQVTVDEYVVSECDRIHDNYKRYVDLLLNHYPHVYVTKYEDMAFGFRTWLEGLLKYCEFKNTNELFQSLLEESKYLQPKQEDIHKHIRKGKPGDYKEKLRQESIDCLNSKLSFVLERFNYPVS